MTFNEYSALPNKLWWQVTDQGYFDAGAASRDAEVSELCDDRDTWKARAEFSYRERDKLADKMTLLRDVLNRLLRVAPAELECNNMHHLPKHRHTYDETCPVVVEYVEATTSAIEALSATEPGSTRQDKAAIFKSLGLVPWDNKPPACTDTVWIEPGKVATKESQGSKP